MKYTLLTSFFTLLFSFGCSINQDPYFYKDVYITGHKINFIEYDGVNLKPNSDTTVLNLKFGTRLLVHTDSLPSVVIFSNPPFKTYTNVSGNQYIFETYI